MGADAQVQVQSRLVDADVVECPFAFYAGLHAGAEAAPAEPGIGRLVHRYEDAARVGSCPAVYSSNVGAAGAYLGISEEPFSAEVQALVDQYHPMENVLFRADPPAHARQRALVTKALSARRVRALEPSIAEIVDNLIDRFAAAGRCELISEFAVPLPVVVIARLLGVDPDDLPRLKKWSDFGLKGFIDCMDNDQRALAARSMLEFQQYMLPRLAERRESPRDDLLSALIHAEIEDAAEVEGDLVGPRRLTDGEILPIIMQVLVGGNETTTSLLGNAMVTMLRQPGVEARLRADPGLIPNFMEEVLRYESPVLATVRVTTAGATVGTSDIPPGEVVAMMWGAANQDPRMFEDPRTFDMGRANSKRHLAFGHGPHFCPGSNLARAESRIAFERILERLADLRLTEGRALEHGNSFASNGYQAVHLEFRSA